MNGVLVVLFTGILVWINRHDRRCMATASGVLMTLLLVRPAQVQGQGLLSEISVVLKTVNTLLGTLLSTVNTVQSDLRSIQQVAVWPQNMIRQARAYSTDWVNTYQHPMQLLSQYVPVSATLAQARSLEQVMTDRVGPDLPPLSSIHHQVFAPVPIDNRMSPADNGLTDVEDALTLDTLEQVNRGEHVNTTVRNVGDQLEQMSTSATPGTAPFITATALVTMLRSQAATQKMLAAYLRLEGAHLAHETAGLKGHIGATNDLQQTVRHILNTQ
ncbi:MAG: hypothetical protein ACJ746_03440 [Bryobacteraceae bacterium]